jgi:hypothetical protein
MAAAILGQEDPPGSIRLGMQPGLPLERDFRHIKADDLDLRPIWHRLDDRVKAHVLICMLACYLTWHLRKAWAPLTFTDEHPPARANPVAPARRSASAAAKASRKTGPGKQPIRSFRDIIDHLATLTRNDLRYGQAVIPALADRGSAKSLMAQCGDMPVMGG